jgi:hypothetical protein
VPKNTRGANGAEARTPARLSSTLEFLERQLMTKKELLHAIGDAVVVDAHLAHIIELTTEGGMADTAKTAHTVAAGAATLRMELLAAALDLTEAERADHREVAGFGSNDVSVPLPNGQ